MISIAIVLPTISVAYAALNRGSGIVFALAMAASVCLAYVVYYSVRWDAVGVHYRWLYSALFVLAWVGNFITKREQLITLSSDHSVYSMAIHIVLLCIFGYLSIVIASGYKWRGESISLTAPVESNGWVVHGGGTVAVNYHNGVKAQRYALDIIVLDENGRRGRTWLPAELNDFSSFGKSVLSPCDGKVLATENNQEDRAIGELRDDSPAGNFVLLHCHGNTVLLAHLKKGSVLVKTGDSVEPGRPLAKIGNSGRSSEPHLHIHAVKGKVMDMKMVIATGEPVALLINGEFSRRGDILHLNEKTSE